jgi:prolyl oligopeptidase
VVEAVWGRADDLYLISRHQAPRGRILHLAPADAPLEKAKVIIPEGSEVVISTFSSDSLLVATEDRLYVTYQLGGPSEIRAFAPDGRPLDKPAIASLSSVHELTPLEGGVILFLNSSYVQPPAWYSYDPARNETKKTALFSTSPVDFSDAEVAREFAVSKDGTKVPVDIIMPKGLALDGTHPAILYGYGGYNVSLSPGFSAMRHVWIEQGAVYAVAVTRGGGEFGEEWHRSGTLTRKQNVFDDFTAAMEHLVSRGYTRPERLAIIGGSNGGLLMGAMITQQPELFKATVSSVGIYDMLRNELTPNGAFNIPELGTVKDKAQFEALYAYSPYHHVKDGAAYPAVLFMTGANDPRVDPMHSRKMTARLQAASSSGNPILLRTSSTTGHGIGTPLAERIKQEVDEFAFLFYELAVTYKPTR